jgi:dynein heavy chain
VPVTGFFFKSLFEYLNCPYLKIAQKQRKRFTFEGGECALSATCQINITINPNYSGRSPLPDNLKAQFRPIAMMAPDSEHIAEIYLYARGFYDSKRLACKIVAAMRLAQSQLSHQTHYDFGLRAIMGVLIASGVLRSRTVFIHLFYLILYIY